MLQRRCRWTAENVHYNNPDFSGSARFVLLSHALKHWLYNELSVFILYQFALHSVLYLETKCGFSPRGETAFSFPKQSYSGFSQSMVFAIFKTLHFTFSYVPLSVLTSFLVYQKFCPVFSGTFPGLPWRPSGLMKATSSSISTPTTITSPHISPRAQPGLQSPSVTPVLLYILLQCVSYIWYCSALRNFVTS